MSLLKTQTPMPGRVSPPTEETQAQEQEAVRQRIHEGASLSVPYLVMNALAAVVASYGLLENSTAVVIGAMIIALLLGPITGLALALVDGDQSLLRKALVAEVCGVLLVLLIGFLIGKVHGAMSLGSEIMGRTAPNILDLVIALAGGAAGAYATTSPRLSAGLVGVAIATALVPPLCSCGICVAHGLYREGGGAFLLFLTNFVAIQAVTSLVFWINGFHRLSHLDRKSLLRRFSPSAVLLVGLAVFLGRSFQQTLAQETLRSQAEKIVGKAIDNNGAANLTDLRVSGYGKNLTLTAVVRAPWVIQPASCARLQEQIRQATGRRDVNLHVRTVITRECDAQKFLWETSADTLTQGTGP